MAIVWNIPPALPPKPAQALANTGLVARVRLRLFPGNTGVITPSPMATKRITFNASIAEFLLVNRLKARIRRRAQTPEILERAAHVVFVTCRNWFNAGDGDAPGGRTPL